MIGSGHIMSRFKYPGKSLTGAEKPPVPVRAAVSCTGGERHVRGCVGLAVGEETGEALHYDPELPLDRTPPPPHPPSPPPAPRSEGLDHSPPQEEISKEEERFEDDKSHKPGERAGAPLELMVEFLSSVMRRDLGRASQMCRLILLYEPENPEAAQFLPLIQQKVLEGQEKELGTDDDDDDHDEEDEDDDSDEDSESCDEEHHSWRL